MVQRLIRSVKKILFANPKELLEEEKALVNEPFYFVGRNQRAVLLIHGWTTTPYELRRLGKFLNECGYTVCAPLLTGHGTVPEDLENVQWQTWLSDAENSYRKLKATHPKVYVAGTSIGANLAVMLAQKFPEINGLVLMAMPYKLRLEKLVVAFARFVGRIRKYNKKYYPPTFGAATTVTRLISYQRYPISSVLETFALIKATREKLPQLHQPCFILQSTSDHVAAKNSLEEIYRRISSTVKKKKYVHKAYHTFISDIENEHVFEDILNFLEEN